MDGPLVSIVMAVHDDAATVAEAVASVRAQVHPHWELLLVDDGSSDDGIARALAAMDGAAQPVRVLATPGAGAQGPAVARNTGITAATGELLAILDADDVWLPELLAARVERFAADPDLAMVWGPSLYWHPGRDPADDYVQETWFREPTRRFEPGEAIPYWLGIRSGTPSTGTMVVRRAVAVAVGGFPAELRRGEDIAFCLRVAVAHPAGWDGRVLHRYRRHAGSSTAGSNRSGSTAQHDLAGARWVVDFVHQHPELRCQAVAARNLHGSAQLAAAHRPPVLAQAAVTRSMWTAAGAKPFRWWLATDWLLPRRLARRVAPRGYEWCGANRPSAQLPELTEYRGLPIRAAGNIHQLAADLAHQVGAGPRGIELGAGEGALTLRLVDRGIAMDAVELEPDRFAVPGVTAHRVDLNGEFATALDGPYDLVVAVEVIEHLDSPRRFIASAAALLRPGGHLVVSSPNVASWYSRTSFLRSGELHWFNPARFHKDGHVQPVFDWQVHEFGAEAGLSVVATATSDDHLLRSSRLRGGEGAGSWRGWSIRAVLHFTLLRPLMRGQAVGETVVWALRKDDATASGGPPVDDPGTT